MLAIVQGFGGSLTALLVQVGSMGTTPVLSKRIDLEAMCDQQDFTGVAYNDMAVGHSLGGRRSPSSERLQTKDIHREAHGSCV